MEATSLDDPEAEAARDELETELSRVARSAATTADAARAQGLDPLTLRTLALDSGAGANLLRVAPLPGHHSYSSLDTYDRCPLRYAFRYVYRIPEPDRPAPALAFGSIAHAAFEAFTRDRRERAARGDPPPTREDLEREFRARWTPSDFGDHTAEEGYQRKVANLLDNFWQGEVSSLSEALSEELDFELTIDPGDGSAPVVINGQIDRIDRLPSGGIEVDRLQDRPGLQPEGRRREPPALDLRARLPRRAGPGHAGAGDPVLHRVRAAALDRPHGRAAGRRPGGRPGAGRADAGGGVRGHARRSVPLL